MREALGLCWRAQNMVVRRAKDTMLAEYMSTTQTRVRKGK